jgi:UDP-N-acetylglucosamine:LPS N-acetylglucosamine transferase
MGLIYRACDLALSRAGASTITELSLYGVPALFIPFPYAIRDHQYYNAKEIEELGGGLVIRQEKAELNTVLKLLEKLLSNREEFSKAITRFAEQNPCEKILNSLQEFKEIEELGGGLVIRQEKAELNTVLKLLEKLLSNREEFSKAITRFAEQNPCEKILNSLQEFKEIEELGGGLVIRQEKAELNTVLKLLEKLLSNREEFSKAITRFAEQNPCEKILNSLQEFLPRY